MNASLFKPALALAVVICTIESVSAQSGGQFEIKSSTIDTGGGTSTSEKFSLRGTVGQPAAGPLAGGRFTLEGGFWTGLQVAQVADAPVLKIKFAGSNAVISWPKSVTGFMLEESESVTGSPWSNTPQSVVDTASEHTVTVPANGVIKVFRLKK